MAEVSPDEMYQNALNQLNRVEVDVISLVDKLDLAPADPDPRQLREDYQELLLKVREATGVHDALGRLVLWSADEMVEASKVEAVIQVNRAVVIQALAYIAATHYLKRIPGVVDREDVVPLEDARRLLLTGQLWRERMDAGFARRTAIRLKRWIVGREPMGGADLDSRVDSAMHGQHAVAALGHIKWSGIERPRHKEGTRAADLLSLGVRQLQERRLGYKEFSPLPVQEVLSACARLELLMGVENSSSDIYLAKSVLAAVRVACFLCAAEQFWRMKDRRNDVNLCVLEAREELARARRMLAESYRHWLWDLVRRLKRRPAEPPFETKISYRQVRSVIEIFTRQMRNRSLVFLLDRRRRRPGGLGAYARRLYLLSRTSLGSTRFQRPLASRRWGISKETGERARKRAA